MAEIIDVNESWEGHTHEEVEQFVRKKINNLEGGQYTQITVSIIGSTIKTFIDKAENVTFQFKVNNLVNGDFDSNFRVKITIGDDVIDYNPKIETADIEITSPNIAGYLNKYSTDTVIVKISAYTDDSSSTTRSITFTRKVAILSTANNINNTNPSILTFTARFSGYTAKLITRFFGATGSIEANNYVDVETDLRIAGQCTAVVPKLTPGAHKVQAWILLEDGETTSQICYTSIIITTGASEDDCYITYSDIKNAKQNDYTNISFACYVCKFDDTISYPVILQEFDVSTQDYVTKATRLIKNKQLIDWQYLVPNINNMLKIIVPKSDGQGNIVYEPSGEYIALNSLLIEFEAEATDISWTVKANPVIYLSAQNRTNKDSNVDSWIYNNYSVAFENMQWDDYNSGWRNQESLHLIGYSKAYIKDFYPFYDATLFKADINGGGILNKGLTMKLRFKVSNVSNPDIKCVSCIDETTGYGFYITGDAIYINLGAKLTSDPKESQEITGHNTRRFSSDTIMDLTITLQPYYDENKLETKHEVRYYVNGEIAAFGVVEGTNISQNALTKTLIEFGGLGCALDIYDFRFYDSYTDAFNVLQTRTMDLTSAIDIKNTFDKNNYYDLDGTGQPIITVTQGIAYGKYLAEQGKTNFAVIISTDLCNGEGFIGSTSFNNSTDLQSFYIIRFTTDEEGKGIIDDTETIWIEGKAGGALRMRRQGTSTAGATKGNVRIDIRGNCVIHNFNSATQTFFEDGKSVKKGYKPFMIPNKDAIPCKVLTMKKNANESTQCRNLPTAKWYEDCCRYLATVNTSTSGEPSYDYEDCLTPPQRRELAKIIKENPKATRDEQVNMIKIRQCVDGFPSIAFEMTRTTSTQVAVNPVLINNIATFGGQFDLITDKTNMGVFGFGGDGEVDEDFSIEWRENKSAVCCFHTADLTTAGTKCADGSAGKKELEYRYPNDDRDTIGGQSIGLEPDGPIQKLFDFVCTCSKHNIGYIYEQGVKKSSQGKLTINGVSVTDNLANRNLKFKSEFHKYVVINQFLFNGLAIDRGLMCDQDVKNQFFTYLTGDKDAEGNKLLRFLGYDFDSSWGCDNDNYFRFLYTVLYSDGIYDGNESGRGSDLWELVFENFKPEITQIAKYLYKGGLLNKDSILNYMHTNQIDVYNSMLFNANSEYSYTEKAADYEKAHGSAREHNEWFVKGRMYFTAGSTFSDQNEGSDFASDMAYFNVTTFANLDERNRQNNQLNDDGSEKYWGIDVQAYERTYAYLRVDNRIHDGGFVNVTNNYNSTGMFVSSDHDTLHLKTDSKIQGGSDTRFYFYGGRHIKSITGLSDWYLSRINQWGELINLEELNLGREDSWYNNPALTSLNIGSEQFGSCKKLNLAGCTGFSGILSLAKFPVLEEFIGTNMPKLTGLELPSGNSIRIIKYPANIEIIDIENKFNIESITFENVDNIKELKVVQCNSYLAKESIHIIKTMLQL